MEYEQRNILGYEFYLVDYMDNTPHLDISLRPGTFPVHAEKILQWKS